jgi:2'-5' RNA ligase
MGRHNIGVAIGIPEPYKSQLQDARERHGDPNASDIPPHLTLLPPTVMDSLQMPLVEQHLKNVAHAATRFSLKLRGTGTFRPVSPVVFVPVVEGEAECRALEEQVRGGPIKRQLKFPYHPHVTIAHDVRAELLDRAFTSMASYEVDFPVESFQLFEQRSGVWRPLQEFWFPEAAEG